MKRITIMTLGVTALLAVFVEVSQAATVVVSTMSTGANSFDVFLSDSLDNNGIASYGIPIVGDIVSIDHNSAWTAFAQDGGFVGGAAGFSFLRSADGVALVGASQDTITPTPHLIFGMGQVASDFASEGLNAVGGTPDGGSWDVPMRIASVVTGPGGATVDISQDSGAFANVFIDTNGRAEAAVLTDIPEPGTLVLCGLSLIGIVTTRRRLA